MFTNNALNNPNMLYTTKLTLSMRLFHSIPDLIVIKRLEFAETILNIKFRGIKQIEWLNFMNNTLNVVRYSVLCSYA